MLEMSKKELFSFVSNSKLFSPRGCSWHPAYDDAFDDVDDARYDQVHIRFLKDGETPYHILSLHNDCVTLWDKNLDEHFVINVVPKTELMNLDMYESATILQAFSDKVDQAAKDEVPFMDFLNKEVLN